MKVLAKLMISAVVGSALTGTAIARTSQAGDVPSDSELRAMFQKAGIVAMEAPRKDSKDLIELGRELYFEEELSGNRNISCSTCHHPDFGSSDGLPLPIGEGGIGEGGDRQFAAHGLMIPRSAPAVFNLGQDDILTMFWDGRLKKDADANVYLTPEKSFNGVNPSAKEIVDVLDSALAAQAIFPVTSAAEMRGQPGTNDLADLTDNLDIWAAIMKRLMVMPKYQKMFAEAYPATGKFNIGHVGKALAAFERFAFDSRNNPMQTYLEGNNSALTPQQKVGAKIFMGIGRCAVCHTGPHLASNDKFFATGIPQIGEGKNEETGDDIGRARETKRESDKYAFRVMSLINISESAPYMHDGAFATLEEVVEHYNDADKFMREYDGSTVERQEFLGRYEEVKDLNKERMKNVPLVVKKKRKLFDDEKAALVEFLRNGLKDQSYIKRAQAPASTVQ